jgi:hypothetical protein
VSAKGRIDELQILCKQKNIPIEEELDEVVEGWEGKPKGMLQIMWERGFVDPSKKKEDYTPRQEGCFWKSKSRNKSKASDESSD